MGAGESILPRLRAAVVRRFLFPAGLLVLLAPPPARSQVTLDAARPFGQGQVILLPGTSDYLGDLPHDLQVGADETPYRSFGGWLESQVGWTAPPGAVNPGLRAQEPGVLFDEIPYPFLSAQILNWMPAGGAFEAIDFPASAWWGPNAAAGAVQLRAPALQEEPQGDFSAWAGAPWSAGAKAGFHSPSFSAAADERHGTGAGDAIYATSLVRWLQAGSTRLESGFLGARRFSGDDWYAAYTNLDFSIQDFQTIRVKPYFQTASLGGRRINEVGGQLDYLFNMAGLAESHFGVGVSHDDLPAPSGSGGSQRGYFQNMELFDILGSLTLDTAFRWDFSSLSPGLFSALVGVQYNQDAFCVMGDYAKSRPPSPGTDLQQAEAGIRLQPGEEWSLAGKYILQQVGGASWNGGQLTLRVNRRSALLAVVTGLKLEAEGRVLAVSGTAVVDAGGRIGFTVLKRLGLWAQVRGFTGTPFYAEAGGDFPLGPETKIFAAAANLGNAPVSWPDPLDSAGRVLWAGVETGF